MTEKMPERVHESYVGQSKFGGAFIGAAAGALVGDGILDRIPPRILIDGAPVEVMASAGETFFAKLGRGLSENTLKSHLGRLAILLLPAALVGWAGFVVAKSGSEQFERMQDERNEAQNKLGQAAEVIANLETEVDGHRKRFNDHMATHDGHAAAVTAEKSAAEASEKTR